MTDRKKSAKRARKEQQLAAAKQDQSTEFVTEAPSAMPAPEQSSAATGEEFTMAQEASAPQHSEEPSMAEEPLGVARIDDSPALDDRADNADTLCTPCKNDEPEAVAEADPVPPFETPAMPDMAEAAAPAASVENPEPDFVLAGPEETSFHSDSEDSPEDDAEDDPEDDSEGGAADDEEEQEQPAPVKEPPHKRRSASDGPFGGRTFGPVIPSHPLMQGEDGKLVPTPPTIASRLFTVLSLLPILLPLALLAAQVLFSLDGRALWYSDEVRYANAFENMVQTGNWLTLQLNGAMYPDKPPLFFWFLQGISDMMSQVLPGGIGQPMLFFVGVAVSGLLCLLAAHTLASSVARVDRRTVLAANLILLSGFFFAGLMHYVRMDLLFTALITFSHVLLFHAWVRERAPFLMFLGFLAAGAAVLVKGPLGLAFPLLAGLCFLLWQGRIGRFFRLDAIFGIIVGLAVPGVWLTLAWMNLGDEFLNNILYKQVLARALDTWHHAEPWYHYLMTFPAIWLPWTLLLLFLPWGRLFGKGMREGLKTSRTKDGAGLAYMWCAFLPGVILLSAVSIKLPIYCLPLFPPLAVICARAVMQMRPFAVACMQYTFAILLAVLGLSLMITPIVPLEMLHLPVMPKGTIIAGGVCLVFACALGFLVRPRRAEGMVLLMALFTTAFSFPAWTIVAPSLDSFLSPKAQAEVIKNYRENGYTPASFKVYPGTYSYYAGTVPVYESWEEALQVAEKNEKTILALRASFWDKLENKPTGFTEVNRQVIAERAYVLVARPAPGGVKADDVPEKVDAPAVPAPESVDAPEEEQQGEGQPEAVSEQPAVQEAAPVSVPDAAETAGQPALETQPDTATPVEPAEPTEAENSDKAVVPAS